MDEVNRQMNEALRAAHGDVLGFVKPTDDSLDRREGEDDAAYAARLDRLVTAARAGEKPDPADLAASPNDNGDSGALKPPQLRGPGGAQIEDRSDPFKDMNANLRRAARGY